MGAGGVELIPDSHNHLVELLDHLVVPEANHPKSAASNLRGANEVTSIGLVAAVLPAIQLNDDAGSRAREVRDVPANRHLPPEPEAQFSMPKATPQPALAVGHVASQLLRAADQLPVMAHHDAIV